MLTVKKVAPPPPKSWLIIIVLKLVGVYVVDLRVKYVCFQLCFDRFYPYNLT